jgi:hypothetical protein
VSYLNRRVKINPGLIGVLAALTLSGPALSAPTTDVLAAGGTTSVQLSEELIAALSSLQVQPGVTNGSSLSPEGLANFPISGGAIDLGTVKAELTHRGGLSLSTAQTNVKLTDFVITTVDNKPVLTGLVIVNDDLVLRAPLFNLALPAVQPPLNPRGIVLKIPDVGVALTSEAASLLNSTFGVDAFTPGFNIGTADVQAFVHPR